MYRGELRGIYIASTGGVPLVSVGEVEAVVDRGLVGDRYFAGGAQGVSENPAHHKQQVTLIELEALEALQRDYQIVLQPSETRRNLLTVGVPLNHLVGCQFAVGPVVLEGLELCEPCSHLERLTQQGVKRGLLHRGGLRAKIVYPGQLRVGNFISPPAKSQPRYFNPVGCRSRAPLRPRRLGSRAILSANTRASFTSGFS